MPERISPSVPDLPVKKSWFPVIGFEVELDPNYLKIIGKNNNFSLLNGGI